MFTQTREKTNLSHLIANIYSTLPRSVLAIEDIVIKDNQVIVSYKTKRNRNSKDLSFINNSHVVTVNSFDALRLRDGKVIEHQDTVYQIKPSLQYQRYS